MALRRQQPTSLDTKLRLPCLKFSAHVDASISCPLGYQSGNHLTSQRQLIDMPPQNRTVSTVQQSGRALLQECPFPQDSRVNRNKPNVAERPLELVRSKSLRQTSDAKEGHICDIGRPNLSSVLLARHDHREHLLDQISVEGFRLLKGR